MMGKKSGVRWGDVTPPVPIYSRLLDRYVQYSKDDVNGFSPSQIFPS
jgi:hypothetical protein